MGLSFLGEYRPKVDGKGRMSIPADFRRVLEEGDPEFPAERTTPRLVVLYGRHLENKLQVYTIEEMARVADAIMALPSGSAAKKYASKHILGRALKTEVDRDGRLVLPKERREQIELEDESVMLGLGDHFEIYSRAHYDAAEAEDEDDLPEGLAPDGDPMSLLQLGG